jgi:hypothetical protein
MGPIFDIVMWRRQSGSGMPDDALASQATGDNDPAAIDG